MNKVTAAVAIIGAVAALGGGSFITYQNTITNISSDDDTTITNEGDININTEGDDFCELALIACEEDIIPEQYEAACPVLDIICR